MSYPSAPWLIKGYAIYTLHLVDIAKARPLIPAELDIISLWPGKTLGGVYISNYGAGSVLEYNELIVVAGLTRYAGKIGAWISHIYVDNLDSVAGGREIWGLPKEMADFTWENSDKNRVKVQQGDRLLCSLSYSQPLFTLPQKILAYNFSGLSTELLCFEAQAQFNLGLISSTLQVTAESPFHNLNFGKSGLSFYLDKLNLLADVPEIIGQKQVNFSSQ